MNNFPSNGRKAYAPYGGALLEDHLSEFKSDVKSWLKGNRLNYRWLALNINRAEGTVKNWLYNTKMQIPDPAIDLIFKTCNAHEAGADYLSYEHCGKHGSIRVVGYVEVFYPKNNRFSANLEAWYRSINCRYEPEMTMSEYDLARRHSMLAEWVTDRAMSATKRVLREAKESDKDMVIKLLNEEENTSVRDACFPHSSCSYVPDAKGYCVPVILEDWDERFLRLAAKIQELSPEDWLTKCLNDAATRRSTEDLEAFLGEE